MLEAYRNWRRERILKRSSIDEAAWRAVLARFPFTQALLASEQTRLRDLAALFLHEKSIVGAGGLMVSEEMRIAVATQACILILNLDIDYYRGWTEVIVYPDEFVAEYEYMDESGIAHHVAEPMTGESWLAGPVVLSWADAEQRGGETGYNVVIHEFAHKIDMLNGNANGFPPLHAGMSRGKWAEVFSAAYADLRRRVDRGDCAGLDPYAAESPAEYFAVLSEAFFEVPDTVRATYGEVYCQLATFYRQDPAARRDRQLALATVP